LVDSAMAFTDFAKALPPGLDDNKGRHARIVGPLMICPEENNVV